MEIAVLLELLFDLPQMIRMAADFANGTRDLVVSDRSALDGYSPEEIDRLRSAMRSILRTCIAAVIICGLAIPLGFPWLLWMVDDLTAADATERMICGAIFLFFLIPPSMFLGASVACLFAPADFLQSPFGNKWLSFIGTKNIVAARVVSFVSAASLALFFAGYCLFIYSMHRI